MLDDSDSDSVDKEEHMIFIDTTWIKKTHMCDIDRRGGSRRGSKEVEERANQPLILAPQNNV